MYRHTTRRAVALALAPLALLTVGCSADDPRTTVTSSTSSSAGTTTSALGFTPIPTDGAGPIPAGKVGMTANGRADAPWAVYTVPEGWETLGGWTISSDDPGSGGLIGYWTIDNVYRDPCTTAATPPRIPAGRTVQSLAAAFGQQRQSRVTRPVPVTVDGYRGLSLEVHAPATVNFETCGPNMQFRLWEWSTAGERYMQEPGFDKLYLLDVDGKVVVLQFWAAAGTSEAVVDRVSLMLESVDFVPRT